MHTIKNLTVYIAAAILISGCVQTQYDWGSYPDDLYRHYKNPGDASQLALMEELTKIFQRAEKKGSKPPPGLYAEYGNLQLQKGEIETAILYFEKEKKAWPDSATFMDSLISSLNKQLSKSNTKDA